MVKVVLCVSLTGAGHSSVFSVDTVVNGQLVVLAVNQFSFRSSAAYVVQQNGSWGLTKVGPVPYQTHTLLTILQ